MWGGCWCMAFHSEGVGPGHTPAGNREAKRSRVCSGSAHAALVYDDRRCVGWCQYGPTEELPNIKNPKAYARELNDLPDWRITCVFTGKGRRRRGIARAAVAGALQAIAAAGGGLVEAYPEQVEHRKPQPGAFFHTGAEPLFASLGFERDRRIAKWRWVLRLRVSTS